MQRYWLVGSGLAALLACVDKGAPASKAPSSNVSPGSSSVVPPRSGATGFEETKWGASCSSLRTQYKLPEAEHPQVRDHVMVRRDVAGIPCELGFHCDEAGLYLVEVGVLRGPTKVDEAMLVDWISRAAGTPYERHAGIARWTTPSATILLFADESLGAAFAPRNPAQRYE